MRIVHLMTVDLSLRYLLLDQLRYLAAQGHEIHVICAPGPNVSVAERAGVRVHTIDLSRRVTPLRDAKSLWQIVKALGSIQPDLVHTHTPKASLLGQYAAVIARVPYRVHTIHGLYLPVGASGLRRRAFLWLERLTMCPADVVLSQSAEDVLTCRRYHLCPPSRLRYLGNGIDIERFHPATAKARQDARDSLNIPGDHQVVGLVGRLVREKGVLEFFAATKQILARWPKTLFLVIGDADTAKPDAIVASDGRADLDARTRFLGHRDDLPTIYQAMDVLLHPSHREGFPRVPMEASASGVPVIATDIRGNREVVREGINGLLVPLRDPKALADATSGLLADPIARSALSEGGRALALEAFDQRVVFGRVQATYEALVSGRST